MQEDVHERIYKLTKVNANLVKEIHALYEKIDTLTKEIYGTKCKYCSGECSIMVACTTCPSSFISK